MTTTEWGEPYGYMLRRIPTSTDPLVEDPVTEVPLFACPHCGALVPRGRTAIHQNFHAREGMS